MKKPKRCAVIVLGIGILFLLYPCVTQYLTRKQQEAVIVGYENMVADANEIMIQKEWEKAENYNKDPKDYISVLNPEGNGVIGYIEIPKIQARIPIYHYATEKSLEKGVGHVEQTKLPIGGKGNHPVLTGHRGLPNAELFTRLDEMEIGDVFFICVLDQVLAYKVNQISIVLPEEVKNIAEKKNQDLLTLVTCTPYGINTHRLLVTGERTQYSEQLYDKEEVNDSKRNKIIFCIIIIFTGITVLMYPHITDRITADKIKKEKTVYIRTRMSNEKRCEKLYKELKSRNEMLYETEQKEFCSAESYKEPDINLKVYGIKSNTIGYLSIPDINIDLPIILGANEENMKRGAAHLTGTSYPIGGINTNSVIAAHRGYSRMAMFRNIDQLQIGDKVYIENFREKLSYKVAAIRIIEPSDVEQILIQEGKDMVTLITCHPYRKNFQRYVVFCEKMI